MPVPVQDLPALNCYHRTVLHLIDRGADLVNATVSRRSSLLTASRPGSKPFLTRVKMTFLFFHQGQVLRHLAHSASSYL